MASKMRILSHAIAALVISAGILSASQIEILRDRWGVLHIYAGSAEDLFYAQGYYAAMDRLFQIDLWRRTGTGKLAEVLGPAALPRDRVARLVRYRGDWNAEWQSYSPDTRMIAENFVAGINAYIKSLNGKRPKDFQAAGYDPEPWAPEDITARVAGLLTSVNATSEITRAEDIRRFGLERVQQYLPPDPFVRLTIPKGLDLSLISMAILRDFNVVATETAHFDLGTSGQGSNQWVVDGSMTASGKPLLANDPHRALKIPALRKTVHLVAPGIDAIGGGEPALPGIALGHNKYIAWGFTIAGVDQQDFYVEKLNPQNPDQYLYRGSWRDLEIEHQKVKVKGQADADVELRYSIHGPILHEDRARHVAYALKAVTSEPGGAGYLGGLALMRAKNWNEFVEAAGRYKVPSQNIVYADVNGNIGWVAAGLAPIRKNWSGLLPVPGDTGEYEWGGYLPISEMPQVYNPARHFVATANNNILPPGYTKQLAYEWSMPFRVDRITSVLPMRKNWDPTGFEQLQGDVLSLAAKRFQAIVRKWTPPPGTRLSRMVGEFLNWDAQLRSDSRAALVYEFWISKLPAALFGPDLGARVDLTMVLKTLEAKPDNQALAESLETALAQLDRLLPDQSEWKWGRVHQLSFRHPLENKAWNRGPLARGGDVETVNSAGGKDFQQEFGASYRQIIDLGDWDRSEMTNTPGESGDPSSKHYDDLIDDWANGRYHPMAFSRKAVEAVTTERYWLTRK
jgi:penicillin amidase